jgi:hypothetical protein
MAGNVARWRSSVPVLKNRVTLRYTATPVATATRCYSYATTATAEWWNICGLCRPPRMNHWRQFFLLADSGGRGVGFGSSGSISAPRFPAAEITHLRTTGHQPVGLGLLKPIFSASSWVIVCRVRVSGNMLATGERNSNDDRLDYR